jgi:HrpA-like RNA helicase
VAIREKLLAALRKADAVVVSGETGSGKTCAEQPVDRLI